ncbi:MAG TPA: hypothetical protein VJS66_08080 [Burkholderiales bacterium]|nr:hypothetical protein [Burkholderiales bacterium]
MELLRPTTPAGQTVSFIVYRADTGAQVATTSTSGANATITINSLPMTGNYYLFVNPTSYGTATMNVTHTP